VLGRVATVVDHDDVPLHRARLDRERVHGRGATDDDELGHREERFDVHLERTLALTRHRDRPGSVALVVRELVGRPEEQ
jgi:hypothetical protein